MAKEMQFDPEKMEIKEFKLLKGQVDAPEDFNSSVIKGHQSTTTLELSFNIEEGLVRAIICTDIKTESNGANIQEASGSFHLVYIYRVENIEDWASVNKDGYIICNPLLANALSTSSYSTSRGILLTRLQGTALSEFILPIINPQRLFQGVKKQ